MSHDGTLFLKKIFIDLSWEKYTKRKTAKNKDLCRFFM